MTSPTATLLISCPDKRGLVAKIANFIYANGGNIIHADQHTDFAAGLFLTRIEWQLDGFNLPRELIAPAFNAIAQPLSAKWELHFSDTIPRIAIWVSKQDHCLFDLIWRQRAKEFASQIPLIISNHPDLKLVAEKFNIDYHHIPVTKDNKSEQEAKQLELLHKYKIDLVVLAKYMQVSVQIFLLNFLKLLIFTTHFYQLLSAQIRIIELLNVV
jgi:formyltetrahydrofolate deformylase